MRAVILAGGLGTRLQEETTVRPKPMVEVGGKPVLWHIMSSFAHFGVGEFVVALGYKGEWIKDYFLHYRQRSQSLSVSLRTGEAQVHGGGACENWLVHLLDTGLHSQTGGRLKQASAFLGEETFLATYGDGVCDVDIARLIAFHRSHGKKATLTAVRPPARFGGLRLDEASGAVVRFEEKPQIGEGWINGGFFVLEPGVRDYIQGDETLFEREPLERLAAEGELMAYQHGGFWQCMDTLRDVQLLESLWQGGHAPWAPEALAATHRAWPHAAST